MGEWAGCVCARGGGEGGRRQWVVWCAGKDMQHERCEPQQLQRRGGRGAGARSTYRPCMLCDGRQGRGCMRQRLQLSLACRPSRQQRYQGSGFSLGPACFCWVRGTWLPANGDCSFCVGHGRPGPATCTHIPGGSGVLFNVQRGLQQCLSLPTSRRASPPSLALLLPPPPQGSKAGSRS